MARNKTKQIPDDEVFHNAPQGGASGAPPATEQPPLVDETPILPSAVRADDFDGEPIPVKKYQVVGGGPIMIGSCRTRLPANKIIDDRGYDIALVRSQGIELREIEG